MEKRNRKIYTKIGLHTITVMVSFFPSLVPFLVPIAQSMLSPLIAILQILHGKWFNKRFAKNSNVPLKFCPSALATLVDVCQQDSPTYK